MDFPKPPSHTKNNLLINYKLPKIRHLRSGRDFQRVYAKKIRAGDEHLLIFADKSPTQKTRFGLSVSKKHGNAVIRARIKRLLREAYRLNQHDLPEGLDLIFIPRFHSNAGLMEYQNSLKQLIPRLNKKMIRKNQKNI